MDFKPSDNSIVHYTFKMAQFDSMADMAKAREASASHYVSKSL